MVDILVEYLSTRPIAPILRNSKEKNDIRALKLMTIVDYDTEHRLLYIQFEHQPKLLQQLMQFSYADFKYYNVQVNRAVGKRLLQCKFCELIAPYALTLTHMALNHHANVSTKTCAYCNREEITQHSKEKTLQNCYSTYLNKYEIRPQSITTDAIKDFFALLKDLAKQLGVCIVRNESFAGTRYAAVEPVVRKIPNFPKTCNVFSSKSSSKQIDQAQLNYSFRIVCKDSGNELLERAQKTLDNENANIDETNHRSDEEEQNASEAQRSPIRTVGTVMPNIVVKTDQVDVASESSPEPLVNRDTVEDFPASLMVRMPVVTQVHDNTSHRVERQSQPRRFEIEQQTQSAEPGTSERAATKEPEVNERHQENAFQGNHSIPRNISTNETHIKTYQSSADDFGRYVANRLLGISNPIKRRKLELLIQQSIVEIEQADIEDLE